jgi:hypothetical protein
VLRIHTQGHNSQDFERVWHTNRIREITPSVIIAEPRCARLCAECKRPVHFKFEACVQPSVVKFLFEYSRTYSPTQTCTLPHSVGFIRRMVMAQWFLFAGAWRFWRMKQSRQILVQCTQYCAQLSNFEFTQALKWAKELLWLAASAAATCMCTPLQAHLVTTHFRIGACRGEGQRH